jgi:hypothetical protein
VISIAGVEKLASYIRDTPDFSLIMRKFLSCGLIAALAVLPVLRVCAEPPPKEPTIVSSDNTTANDCPDRCPQPQK